MTMTPQQYCLRWKHHHTNVQNMFAQLLEKERFCDVTLYCSPSFATQVSNKEPMDPQNIRGVSLRAHRVVLAACSELLGALLGAHEAHGEPVLVIDGAEPRHLKALLDYMYTGEMNVHHSQLASLLKTAEELRIKGLTDIRWNNKDEPPDSDAGVVATATATLPVCAEKQQEKQEKQIHAEKNMERVVSKQTSPKQVSPRADLAAELRAHIKREQDCEPEKHEKFNVNGGPPPLIKLPTKDKTSPLKREHSDSDSRSPKRQRVASGTDHTDDEATNNKTDRDMEWQHGNLDITAERVVGWGMGEAEREESSRDPSDDEWADAPADIGSFLHTKLRVDGDNSADEESNDSAAGPASRAASSSAAAAPPADKLDAAHAPHSLHSTIGPKSGPTDPRFTDVVKLSDYLQHGRRPQFWEEHYVKRVMEAVRLKELEMKQAAEILGVSYGTLYGRYRDVYGCINRPYRAVRDFWQAKGPSEVLDRLQRGDLSLDAAARALGVTIANLAAHVADFGHAPAAEFEPIPIEVDPSLKVRSRTYSADPLALPKPNRKPAAPAPPAPPAQQEKTIKKVLVGSITDEDPIPATVITTHESKAFPAPAPHPAAPPTTPPANNATGKWPTIRVASLDSLRGNDSTASLSAVTPPLGGGGNAVGPTSPSQLMRTRPDLTIVAARKPEHKRDDDT